MKPLFFAGLAGLSLALGPLALADPVRDAEYIVDTTLTPEQFDAAFVASADLMLGNIQNELTKRGLSVSDEAGGVIVDMIVREMSARMVDEMRVPLVDVYVRELSPEALRAYKAFLETEHGAELVSAIPALMAEAGRIGEAIGEGFAREAVTLMLTDMEAGNWPSGTAEAAKEELIALFNVASN